MNFLSFYFKSENVPCLISVLELLRNYEGVEYTYEAKWKNKLQELIINVQGCKLHHLGEIMKNEETVLEYRMIS